MTWLDLCTPVKFYKFKSDDYFWPLPDGFPPGSRVIIKGTPTADTSDPIFSINFLTKLPGEGEGDIANHTEVRFRAGNIVYSIFLTGEGWQKEEQHPNTSISAGESFKIAITCEITHFSLYINGNHFKDFQQHMSPEKIQCLAIGRSVTVSALTVDRMKSIVWHLPRGFRENDKVVIKGLPGIYKSSDDFDINFQARSPYETPGDIPLSMTVRFKEGKIINGSRKSNVWGEQKVLQNLFLDPEKEFEIAISKRDSFLQVNVDGKESRYDVKIPQDDVKYLTIRGDVYVSSVTVNSERIKPEVENEDDPEPLVTIT